MKKVIVFWLMACWTVLMIGQEDYHIKAYGKEAGLQMRGSVCISQVNGFVWVGSAEGLCGFDGQHTWYYSIPDKEKMGGYFQRVTAILQTPDGTMWVGSKKGIYTMEMDIEQLRPFQPEGLPKNANISFLQHDLKGNLWVIANGQLYKIDTKRKKAEHIGNNLIEPSCLTVAHNGTIWIGGYNGLLYRYDPQNKRFQAYTTKAEGMERFNYLVSIVEMQDGSLALVSNNDGAVLFDLNTYTSKYLFSRDEDHAMVVSHTAITPDGESLWVGTERGIVIYHTKDGRMDCIRQSNNKVNALGDNSVHSLYADRERGVWVGTYFGGIYRISISDQDFSTFMPEGKRANVDVVREICPDRQGHLWVGTEDGSLYLFDRVNKTLTEAPVVWKEQTIPFNIQSLLLVGDDLWVSTIDYGIYVIDTKTLQEKHHYRMTNQTGSGQILRCKSLQQQKGTIFACTTAGVYTYDPKEEIFVMVPETDHMSTHHIYADPHGNVWVMTYDKGLWKIQQKGGKWMAKRTAFDYTCVHSCFEDSKGRLWVGTDKHGLMYFDEKTGKSGQLKTSERLCSQSVNYIMEDAQHNLWLNTFDGLYCYNIDTGLMYHLTTENGLPTDNLNYAGGYVDTDGMLYLGTYKGLVRFDPSSLGKSQERLTPYLLGLFVNGRHIFPNDDTGIMKQSLFLTKELVLTQSQNTFSIAYAVSSYKNTHLIWYRYRLNPNEPWMIINDKNQMLQFNNLAVGDYDVELQASYNPEVWEGDTAKLHITVVPPAWLSGGAILAYILLIIIAVIFVMSFIRRQTESHKLAEAEKKSDS